MIRGSARGSLVLMVGQVVTVIITSLTVIWIARVRGSTAYGQYAVALTPVSIALLFQDLGVNSSITRFCAVYRHEGSTRELKSVVMTGLIFSILTSVVISGFIYFLAGPIASVFLKRPEVEPLVRAASLAVLGGGGLVTTIQAIFVGYEIMSLRSFMQVFWSLTRSLFSIILILSGLGAFGAVLANTISQIVAGLVGLFLLFIFIKFESGSKGSFSWEMLRKFLSYGLPLSMSTLLIGILAQIYNYIMILYMATDLIGNYGAATNFGVLVSFLTVPIATTLFPLFSKFKKGDVELEEIFQTAVKYTSILTLPVVLVIIVVSTPLSRILFGTNDYPYVPLYLSVYIINYAWEGFGGLSLANLISGIGESRVSLRSSILTFFTGLILALILVPRYGMIGLLITIALDTRGGWIYQILWVKRELGITVEWRSTIRLYLVGLAAFIIAYVVMNILNVQGVIGLITGVLTYFIVYLVGLPLSKVIKRNDLRLLETITDTMGPLAPIAHRALSLIGRLVRE
ncbi:MAG: oligosaccharide flippase family protein [Candidatus Bathyarchaeota archaeon]|nr:oligosaccharide flippase family protein [Candidatus Bathyarchaeota archaeon]